VIDVFFKVGVVNSAFLFFRYCFLGCDTDICFYLGVDPTLITPGVRGEDGAVVPARWDGF
jgi:hypothetical protein